MRETLQHHAGPTDRIAGMNTEKIYFASDFHLGSPDSETSREREKRIVQWLGAIAPQASQIYLLGDVFDFWYEYKSVVPKGYVRLLGKIATLVDHGIPVHLFTGNHDAWVFDYLSNEVGVSVHRQPSTRMLLGKKFFLGHGDGLGPGDRGYKVMKRILANPLCRGLFEFIHPNLGVRLAHYLSNRSRYGRHGSHRESTPLSDYDKDRLILFAKEKLAQEPFDYFIFGHLHHPINVPLNGSCRYINLGDWLERRSYAVFDGNNVTLKYYRETQKSTLRSGLEGTPIPTNIIRPRNVSEKHPFGAHL
jgi:UDP-2,3-diacylglucosamine hydrolase